MALQRVYNTDATSVGNIYTGQPQTPAHLLIQDYCIHNTNMLLFDLLNNENSPIHSWGEIAIKEYIDRNNITQSILRNGDAPPLDLPYNACVCDGRAYSYTSKYHVNFKSFSTFSEALESLQQIPTKETSNKTVKLTKQETILTHTQTRINKMETQIDRWKQQIDIMPYNKHLEKQLLWDKIKIFQTKLDKTRARLPELAKIKHTKITSKPKRQLDTHWWHKYHYFYTTGNRLVIGGKNAKQSEYLCKHHMDPMDLWFHSEAAGSGSFILKHGQDCSESELEQVAQGVICHSNAWKENIAWRAYWVFPTQVSKTPESGEYLCKGAFIVRGKRNYTSVAQLEMGYYWRQDTHELILAPYSVARYHENVKITPGKGKPKKLIECIKSKLNVVTPDHLVKAKSHM